MNVFGFYSCLAFSTMMNVSVVKKKKERLLQYIGDLTLPIAILRSLRPCHFFHMVVKDA